MDAWSRRIGSPGESTDRRAGRRRHLARSRPRCLPGRARRHPGGGAKSSLRVDGRISLLEADHQKGTRPDCRHHAAQGRAAGIAADRRPFHQIGGGAGRRRDPRPDPLPRRGTMKASVAEVLSRLTTLSQELAGAVWPPTLLQVVARALTEQLAPGRLSALLLDLDSNRLTVAYRSEEHTSELQSRLHLVCRPLL